MSIHSYLAALGSACLLAGGVAFAQQPGSTSGPASGTNVEPSTAVQKTNPRVRGSSTAAGAPGIEAHPGTEGGRGPSGKPGPGKGAPETRD
jgi:hypothetical protein